MKKLLWLVVVLAALYGLYHLWYTSAIGAVDTESPRRVSVDIEQGWSVSRIADELEERGLVRSSFAFKRYVASNNLGTSLKAGSYVLNTSMDTERIVTILAEGQSSEARITIPEGFTVAQVDALLAEKGIGSPGEFLDCAYECGFPSFTFLPNDQMADREDEYGSALEGYLYPDTYFVSVADYVPQYLIERMLGTFESRVMDAYGDEIEASGHTLHEIITMASLIEEETRTDSERAVVSGILWKRFEAGMGLDVDATVRYITSNVRDPITRSQLETDSPYNTRKYRGLPPGPITNPGIKSIEAALRPEDSPYWFYLHGSDGQIRYAETNDGHNENKARYL